MAKVSIISNEYADNILTFNVVGVAEPITIDVSALSEEIRNRAMLHGLIQKVSDAAAMPKAELTGTEIENATRKRNAMAAVAETIIAGDWSKRREGGAGPVAGIIYRAFAEFAADKAKAAKKPVPTDTQLRALYDKQDRKAQLALRNVPEIAAIIERMKSERPAAAIAAVDTSALLGELGL